MWVRKKPCKIPTKFPVRFPCKNLVAPYRAILRYYRCDTPYRAILSQPSQQSPNKVRYPLLVPFNTDVSVRCPNLQHIARYLCDTPGEQARKSFAILSLKASRDMKSIAAGPLSAKRTNKKISLTRFCRACFDNSCEQKITTCRSWSQSLSVLKRCVPKTLAFAFGLRLRSKTRCFKTRVLGRRLPNGEPQERLRFRALRSKKSSVQKTHCDHFLRRQQTSLGARACVQVLCVQKMRRFAFAFLSPLSSEP